MSIPQLPPDADAMGAALAYASAGWYVLPVRRTGGKNPGKNPGSVVGSGWHTKSSRDAQQIIAWFAGTDYGIALHCGRSGAVVLDVDRPGELPEVLRRHIGAAPYQSTRPDTPGRGHYPFAMPPDRTFGNGTGRLGGAWGEVRGLDGVIIAEPSHHPDGGEYRWQRSCPLPTLPDDVAALLDDASPALDAATDATVAAFRAAHIGNARPELLTYLVSGLTNKISRGESRHMSCVSALTGAMKESRAGYYPAAVAREVIGTVFIAAVSRDPLSAEQGAPRTGHAAVEEFKGIESWAVGQALAADLAETHARVAEKAPEAPPWAQPPASAVSPVDATRAGDHSSVELAAGLDYLIEDRLRRLRIDREARRRLDAEDRPQAEPPPVKSLAALLAEPDAPTRFVVEGLMTDGSRVVFAARKKAGKTTASNNLKRALVDGDPFLGAFAVSTPVRGLVAIDNELDEGMTRRWLRDQRIRNESSIVDVVSLRGRMTSFDLFDDRRRAGWARRLSDVGCDFLLFDCLRPALDAFGLDENRDAGRFLTAFDALLVEAGVRNAVLVHHMGHSGERSRGDSSIEGWPDSIWQLVAESEDPHSPRYFKAFGRDVDVPEGRLSFDPATRHLTYSGGSRGDAKTEAAYAAVIELLTETGTDGLSGRRVEDGVDHPREAVRAALKFGVGRGVITVADGPNRSKVHRIAHPCTACGKPVTSGRERHESCPLTGDRGDQ